MSEINYAGLEKISTAVAEGMRRYVEQRILPGGFVVAVLENDLKQAVSAADDINLSKLPDIVNWCVEQLPSNLWGSVDKVDDWLNCDNATPVFSAWEAPEDGDYKVYEKWGD